MGRRQEHRHGAGGEGPGMKRQYPDYSTRFGRRRSKNRKEGRSTGRV